MVPQRQDAVYDHRAQHVSLPVTVHYEDGGASESVLILSPSHVEQYYTQLGRLIERRKQARERNK
ncbi:hypothetical protein SCATT_15240 [Streptantibioticus cattleyicolor NRRL 8057 = DSM 46488]|uniref:Uncharacterized protein n=1 Tax=Streptantibioticus cattleyicolor (strain ATCC 35852 / DSM 46488 / JCM 4925 / NBRC 14057 / NRRL 8057) TaxID=1003195 RepID=F8K4D6_STREN|nr:hypothetical protein SCATT_15240 [Streptantibioticus cattleyicolor NRRL 8057 = DSM 46488]MYS58576.1 hypothetical protein [Streptomyces sp. SID5468]CCB74242.1 protein of unknown function [Streptantibioticus cattleyicolor NRRL 8057 = DSM 46488]